AHEKPSDAVLFGKSLRQADLESHCGRSQVIYLDTSALIKRFVNEKGSPLVQSLLRQAEGVATAKIAYAEVFAGLARKLREGNIPKSMHALACRQFERDWLAYLRVELHDNVLF